MDNSKKSFPTPIVAAASLILTYIAGAYSNATLDTTLNENEARSAALMPGSNASAAIRTLGELDLEALLKKQDPAAQAKIIEELAQNPSAIANIAALSKHYAELAAAAKTKLMERVGVKQPSAEAAPALPPR